MKAIILKEINSFFGSPIAYLVIGLFLILNGLFLWIFDGELNILNNGFTDLKGFFILSPWILLFLIPAITMRSFSDEIKQGTIELLLTKPISITQIVLGKFTASALLTTIAVIPTLIYVKVLYDLGYPIGNLDMGVTLGSYFGLFFLILTYSAIGTFTSSLTDNQIVAFISAVFICFSFYYGFEGISKISSTESYNPIIAYLGMDYHYKSISRGVIDTRDVIYFMSISVLFLQLTSIRIKSLQW